MPTIDPSRPHAVLAVAGRLPDPGPGFASRHGNHDTAVISPPPSPAVAGTARPAAPRRILGAALRELREDRALRLEDAATRLGVAASTLSRIETGKAPARTSYLTLLLDLYGVEDPGQRSRLADLAREGQRKSWQDDYRDILTTAELTYYGLEAAAARISAYSPHAIPDLVQVPGYAQAACRAARPGLTPTQARRHATVTSHRIEHLNPDRELHLIIDQTALTRPIAPPPVMAAQLGRLHAAAASAAVSIQVVCTGSATAVLSPPFTLLSFTTGPDAAAYTAPGGHIIATTRPRNLESTSALFTRLTATAATPAESAQLIADLASHAEPGTRPPP